MSNVVIHLLLDGKIQELHHYQGKTYVATDATDKKRTISIDGKVLSSVIFGNGNACCSKSNIYV